MTRFFTFLGASWWIIILTIIILTFLKYVTVLLALALKNSELNLCWKLFLYALFATVWALLLIVGVPAVVRYLISVY